MRKIVLVLFGVLLLVVGGYFVLRTFKSPATQTSTSTQPSFPIDGQLPNTTTGSGNNAGQTGETQPTTLTVAAQNPTGNMVVQDFRTNSDTARDPINTSFYYLKYHTAGEGATQNPPYTISYDMVSGSFTIALYQEPLKQTRAEAEQYLMSALGLSQANMCALRYTVSVPGDINEYYSGTNLLFSFCPGATVLP